MDSKSCWKEQQSHIAKRHVHRNKRILCAISTISLQAILVDMQFSCICILHKIVLEGAETLISVFLQVRPMGTYLFWLKHLCSGSK